MQSLNLNGSKDSARRLASRFEAERRMSVDPACGPLRNPSSSQTSIDGYRFAPTSIPRAILSYMSFHDDEPGPGEGMRRSRDTADATRLRSVQTFRILPVWSSDCDTVFGAIAAAMTLWCRCKRSSRNDRLKQNLSLIYASMKRVKAAHRCQSPWRDMGCRERRPAF